MIWRSAGLLAGFVLLGLIFLPPPLIAVDRPAVRLHFFSSPNCPHCVEGEAFLQQLGKSYPLLQITVYDVWNSREDFALMVRLAEAHGVKGVTTPAIFLGDRVWFGFDQATAEQIAAAVHDCLSAGCLDPLLPGAETRAAPPPEVAPLQLPLVGAVDPQTLSLPVLTLLIALLDSVNPCAFFVLLFLLSLLVHARSRRRMLLVGGIFVLCSGLLYFLFMVAWLNLFLLAGELPLVTVAAGVVALLIGSLNVKDFFFFHHGPSLSIPEKAKPGLFARMRGLIDAGRFPSMVAGAVVLALFANSYELLCTAGFPMVYTRILTLQALSPLGYYGYVALYNLIYVLPLLVIVLVFTVTLGSHKMSEGQGRILKLLSGTMMLLLGLALLLAPNLLHSPLTAAVLLLAALLLTGLTALLVRRRPAG
ncbi:MAG: hypothetical protein IH614_13040 [Desulfuromonadales bacterium]|nr:hypothetical protein [Desulfuromonadales bacterium]